MTAARWRVFTYAHSPDGDPGTWLIGSTLWTEDGPQHDTYKVVARLSGTRDEAERKAANIQRAYDSTRRNILESV